MKTARWVSLLLGIAPLWLHGQEAAAPGSSRSPAVPPSPVRPVPSLPQSVPKFPSARRSRPPRVPNETWNSLTASWASSGTKDHGVLAALSVGPDSTGAVKENTLLDLKEGEVVASLDPSKNTSPISACAPPRAWPRPMARFCGPGVAGCFQQQRDHDERTGHLRDFRGHFHYPLRPGGHGRRDCGARRRSPRPTRPWSRTSWPLRSSVAAAIGNGSAEMHSK